MQGDRTRLGLGQLDAGHVLHERKARLTEVVLLGIHKRNVHRKRVLHHDTAGKTLGGELQVIGEREVEIGVKCAIELEFGEANDVERHADDLA